MNRVVITGVGMVTPLATGTEAVWSALRTGRSGVAALSAFDASDFSVRIAAEATDFDPTEFMSAREAARNDRFTQMALAGAQMAVEEAGTPSAPERAGVIIGSGIGGLATIEAEHEALQRGGPRRVSPFTVPRLMPNGAAAAVAMRYGLTGPNFAPSSACATGAHAIGEAYRMIRHGLADVMLAGGSEAALTPLALAAFCRMGALSGRNDEPEKASRPFDRERDGFVFGEGAAVLVLESEESARRRGAGPVAELAGYGASCDAHHVTQPHPEGAGAIAAMEKALDEARVTPAELDHVNAHGTSTPFNDRTEAAAIREVLGPEHKRIGVCATKSQTGHLLGAAGAVEAAFTALAIRDGVVPATSNLDDPDPDCELDHVIGEPREGRVRAALSNSFGFGGQNACLVFKEV
jgi:3-oxoacyl-[acyl-carrier-protein] synthase II